MADSAQKRALENYRRRLTEQGLARFEVLGLDADRDLIRAIAKRLAENDTQATHLRIALLRDTAPETPQKGGILTALRNSPLADAELDVTRERSTGRRVDL